MQEFFMQIKAIFDSLTLVGSLILLQEHVDLILEGLPFDYHSVISVIQSKFETLPIAEVKALLLVHEARLNKFNKQSLFDSPSINYTQEHNKSFLSHGSDGYTVSNKSVLQSDPKSFSNFRGGFGRGGGFNNHGGDRRGGTGGGGRVRGRFAIFQCQVCLKYGHTALVCHYCYGLAFSTKFNFGAS